MKKQQLLWLLFGAAAGLLLGVGAFTINFAKGFSYLSKDSAACANCHIMNEHYSAWSTSSHKAVAQCNDCHTPPGFIAKYVNKASNGFWHSLAFTTGNYPDPIRIKASNLEVTETTCKGCHSLVQHYDQTSEVHCTRCHTGVGHRIR